MHIREDNSRAARVANMLDTPRNSVARRAASELMKSAENKRKADKLK